jgi:hypothetical protein
MGLLKYLENQDHVSNESHNECFQLTLPAAPSSLWATQLKLVLNVLGDVVALTYHSKIKRMFIVFINKEKFFRYQIF